MFSIRWGARERVISAPDRPNGVPSYPAPPRPAAPPCAAPTRPARGVYSTGFVCSCFWRDVQASFSRYFGGYERDPCFLGEQFCRHTVLLDPTSSARPRRAPRPDPPVVCPGFGLDRYYCLLVIQKTSRTAFFCILQNMLCMIKNCKYNPSNPKPRHPTGEAWHGIARHGTEVHTDTR